MSFWNKKPNDRRENVINSKEYEQCIKKFIELSGRIEEVETKVKLLTTDVENLRGNFNRKLKGLKTTEEESEKAEKKTETVIKDEYVAFG